MSLFQPFSRAHAVDISDSKIRLLEASPGKNGILIFAFNEIAVPQGYITEGEIINFDRVQSLLNTLYKNVKGNISSPFTIVSVPERKTFTKVITVDSLPADQMNEAMYWEVEQHFPVTINDVNVGWSLLSETSGKQTVLLSATEKKILEQYITLFDQIKKIIIIAEPESQAVQRAIFPFDETPTLIIDFGASKTSVSIVVNGIIQYTSTLNFCGKDVTQLISKQLNLSLDQAERAKILFGLNEKRGKGVIKKILIPAFEPFIQHIQEIREYYEGHFLTLPKLKQMILCGGGSRLEGIADYLSEHCGLPTKIATPKIDFSKKIGKKFPKENVLHFTTAIGLAMRTSLQQPMDMV